MFRWAALVVAVALAVTGALLAGGGEVPGCESACMTATAHPDTCHFSAACTDGAVVALSGIVTLAVLAAAAPVPQPVARSRRRRDARTPRTFLVTGLDRPPRS